VLGILGDYPELTGRAGDSQAVLWTPEDGPGLPGSSGFPGCARDSQGFPRTPGLCWAFLAITQNSLEELGTPRHCCGLPGIAQDSWQLRIPGQHRGLLGISQDSQAVLETPRGSPGTPRLRWDFLRTTQNSVAVLGTPGQHWGLPGIAQDSLAAQDSRAVEGTPGDSAGLPSSTGESRKLHGACWQLRTLLPFLGLQGVALTPQVKLSGESTSPGSHQLTGSSQFSRSQQYPRSR
jgi:hypothetical protein